MVLFGGQQGVLNLSDQSSSPRLYSLVVKVLANVSPEILETWQIYVKDTKREPRPCVKT